MSSPSVSISIPSSVPELEFIEQDVLKSLNSLYNSFVKENECRTLNNGTVSRFSVQLSLLFTCLVEKGLVQKFETLCNSTNNPQEWWRETNTVNFSVGWETREGLKMIFSLSDMFYNSNYITYDLYRRIPRLPDRWYDRRSI